MASKYSKVFVCSLMRLFADPLDAKLGVCMSTSKTIRRAGENQKVLEQHQFSRKSHFDHINAKKGTPKLFICSFANLQPYNLRETC